MKFPKVQIGWTPLVSEWMKNLDTKGLKIIKDKVERLQKDVMEKGKSRLGKPKTVRQVECVLNYLRVFDDVRLLFHIDRFPDEKLAKIYLLNVSGKKTGEFTRKAKLSAEHLVHSKAFDEFLWNDEWDEEEDDYEDKNSEERSRKEFDKDSSWTIENFQERARRAAIFEGSNPENLLSTDDSVRSKIRLQGNQVKILESNRQFWLLDGVAGTGKTTVLIYRFIRQFDDIFTAMMEGKRVTNSLLYVTHNRLLKEDFSLMIDDYMDEKEERVLLAKSCVNTLDDFLDSLLGEFILIRFKKWCESLSFEISKKEIHVFISFSDDNIEENQSSSLLFHDSFRIHDSWIHFHAIQGDEVDNSIDKVSFERGLNILQSGSMLSKNKLHFESINWNIERKSVLRWLNGIFNPKLRFDRNRHRDCLKKLDIQQIDKDLHYEEFRGILRGYNRDVTKSPILAKEKYMEIGKKRGRVEIKDRIKIHEIANRVMKFWERDNEWGRNLGGWDSQDVVHWLVNELKKLINENYPFNRFDSIFVDEVQDLTHSEMFLILKMLAPGGRLSATGDIAQSVQPSSFTWHDLKELITEVHKVKPESEHLLKENFRSTPILVKVANEILQMQHEVLDEQPSKLQKPFADENGEPVMVFSRSEVNDLFRILKENELPNTRCPILVRDKEKKESLINEFIKYDLETEFIFTIAEFKGMEKTSILLFDPASGSKRFLDVYYDEVRKKSAQDRQFGDKTALLELRHIFVGMTRARFRMGILILKEQNSFIHYLTSKFDQGTINDVVGDENMQSFRTEGLTKEEYEEEAIGWERKNMFSAAATCWKNAHRIQDAMWCESLDKYGFIVNFQKAIKSVSQEIEISNVTSLENNQRWTDIWNRIKTTLPQDLEESTLSNYMNVARKIGDTETLVTSIAKNHEREGEWELAYNTYLRYDRNEDAERVLANLPNIEQVRILRDKKGKGFAKKQFWKLVWEGEKIGKYTSSILFQIMIGNEKIIRIVSSKLDFDVSLEEIDHNKIQHWLKDNGDLAIRKKHDFIFMDYLDSKISRDEDDDEKLLRLAKDHRKVKIIRSLQKSSNANVAEKAKKYIENSDPAFHLQLIFAEKNDREPNFDLLFRKAKDASRLIWETYREEAKIRLEKSPTKEKIKNDYPTFDILCFLSICFDEDGKPRNESLEWVCSTAKSKHPSTEFWCYLYLFSDFIRKSESWLLTFENQAKQKALLEWSLWNKISSNKLQVQRFRDQTKPNHIVAYLYLLWKDSDESPIKTMAKKLMNQLDYATPRQKFVDICYLFKLYGDHSSLTKTSETEHLRKFMGIKEAVYKSEDERTLTRGRKMPERFRLDLDKCHVEFFSWDKWCNNLIYNSRRLIEDLIPDFEIKISSFINKKSRRLRGFGSTKIKKKKISENPPIDEQKIITEPFEEDNETILQQLESVESVEEKKDPYENHQKLLDLCKENLSSKKESDDYDPYDDTLSHIQSFVGSEKLEDIGAYLDSFSTFLLEQPVNLRQISDEDALISILMIAANSIPAPRSASREQLKAMLKDSVFELRNQLFSRNWKKSVEKIQPLI